MCITSHKWDIDAQEWHEHGVFSKRYSRLYNIEEVKPEQPVQKAENPFTLMGYILLGGRGIDGIKYIWKKDGNSVESLAFNRRLKDLSDPADGKISAYTTSVSYGCQLSASNVQCQLIKITIIIVSWITASSYIA